MNNRISFRQKIEFEDAIFRIATKRFKSVDGVQHSAIINIDDGEYAAIIVWDSIEVFLEMLNRDVILVDLLRPYVETYQDGREFHSMSGPCVDLDDYPFSIT